MQKVAGIIIASKANIPSMALAMLGIFNVANSKKKWAVRDNTMAD